MACRNVAEPQLTREEPVRPKHYLQETVPAPKASGWCAEPTCRWQGAGPVVIGGPLTLLIGL